MKIKTSLSLSENLLREIDRRSARYKNRSDFLHCDGLVSLPKTVLTHYIGSLSPQKVRALNSALRTALDLLDDSLWTASLN